LTFNFVKIIDFPIPVDVNDSLLQPTILQSTLGNSFLLEMDRLGQVYLTGEFENSNEELIVNLTPYLARLPIVYEGVAFAF